MAQSGFKGSGYTGTTSQIHITTFEVGPFPPRARLFDRAVLVAACTEFQVGARQFLVNQEYLAGPPEVQDIIPGIAPVPAPPAMEVLVWFTGFVIRDDLLMFAAELRTSEKLPTRARKLIGENLSKALKRLVGIIECRGGTPGDLVPAADLITEPVATTPPLAGPIPELP